MRNEEGKRKLEVGGAVVGSPDSLTTDEGEVVENCNKRIKLQQQEQEQPSLKPKETTKESSINNNNNNNSTDEKYIEELIKRARIAQKVIENATQEQVDMYIKAMVYSVSRDGVAEEIAKKCVEETRLGDYNGKLTKIKIKTKAGLMDIINEKSVGIIETDQERNIVKIAKPVGVIGASSPSTNPEATPVLKAINAIKGRNAIIIAPHPRAKETNTLIVNKMRNALKLVGAPEDLVISIPNPTRETTVQLMKQCDLVLATGGSNIVKRAYTSGTPSIGVGVGNAAVFVDQTADLGHAAKCIKRSKTFDLAASCSSDNAILAETTVYDELLNKLIAQGGHLASSEEKKAIQHVLWKPNGQLNPQAVVKPASEIAKLAGITIPESKTFIIVQEQGVGKEYPFSGEKLSVVLSLYKVDGVDHAISLINRLHQYQGIGHSCGMYSSCEEDILKLSTMTKVSRVMINQPTSLSNSGGLHNGMRQTLSLGCGTWGGSSTTENVNWKQLVNITYVSKPLATPKMLPSDDDLFDGVTHFFQ